MYPMQIHETILFPYTLPNARQIPRANPAISAKNVRYSVTDRPSRRFGRDSMRKSKNDDAILFPPYVSP